MTVNEKVALIKERKEILQWFNDNDYIVNKINANLPDGDRWELTDQRWIDYVTERQNKRQRYDEIALLLEN